MEMKFDPMTGKPINHSAPKFDPMTGKPLNQNTGKRKGGKGKKVGLVIALVLVVAVLIGGVSVVAFSTGLIAGPEKKVILAAYNTFSEKNQLTKNLNTDVLEKDEFTATITAYVDGVDVSATLVNAKKEKQVSADVSAYGMSVNAIASLDDTYLKLQMPTLADTVFAYNYTEDNTGYLAQMMGYEVTELLNESLGIFHDLEWKGTDDELVLDIAAVLKDDLKTLEMEKTDKRQFSVDGEMVDCKGYTLAITESFVTTCIQDVADVIYSHYGTMIEEALAMEGYYTSWNEVVSELLYELQGMPEVRVSFYLEDNKLASVILSDGYSEEIQLLFKGGETRMQNMELLVDGYSVIRVEGTTEGTVETMRVYSEDYCVLDMFYDAEDGYFSMQDSYGDFYAHGYLLTTNKEFYVSFNEIYVDGTSLSNISMDVTAGADPVSLEGEMIDVGNASEAELGSYLLQYEDYFDEFYY